MAFSTKLDYSNNRQIKQYPETTTVLSGATHFGVPFSALTTGPDLTTSGVTSSITNVVSTFSGDSGTTVYTWFDSRMNLGDSTLSALTISSSGVTQNTGPVFTANTTTIIDGNSVTLTYSGVSFDITPISVISLGGGAYSGTVHTNELDYLSAGTLDFTGRTIWVDVSGLTRTNNLILTQVGSSAFVNDIRIDGNGFLTTNTSDGRLKENIKPLNNSLYKIKQLKGVTYEWIDKQAGGLEPRLGFIAQDVEKVDPLLVFTNKVDGYKGIHIDAIIPILVEAVKELASGDVRTVTNVAITTQSITAEDNNIDLNFNGTRETAINGGIRVLHGLGEDESVEMVIDVDGNWTTNTGFIPKSLIIPTFTPDSTSDSTGNEGYVTRDDNYIYVKTSSGWKRSSLESF